MTRILFQATIFAELWLLRLQLRIQRHARIDTFDDRGDGTI